jgi:hypothetical protein
MACGGLQQRLNERLAEHVTSALRIPGEVSLPGIASTGRKVTLPHVVVMGIVNGKVAHEHIYWDQASLLWQVSLLDPAKLPVVGAEQANEPNHRAARAAPRTEKELDQHSRVGLSHQILRCAGRHGPWPLCVREWSCEARRSMDWDDESSLVA